MKLQKGASLIEILIASAIFVMLSVTIFFTYGNIVEIIGKSEHVNLATVLLNQEMEFVRNLNYDDVGIDGGSPPGVIPAVKEIEFQGVTFEVYAFVRNIDDYFDGTVTTTPQDTAPADRKLVELRAECAACVNYRPISATSWVAPAGLEAATENGSLFINVFDANGDPVQADIVVSNTIASPTVSITDTTNVDGMLQLIDIPTSTNGYEITVTKTGYSSATTYAPGDSANPNPIQPHSTVASQELTSISFAIDETASLGIATMDQYCAPIADINLDIDGAKLIGASPDVLKFSTNIDTDSSGEYIFTALEWDTYTIQNQSTSYVFAGSNAYTPIVIDPGTQNYLRLTFEPASSNALLVSVLNASNTLVADATIDVYSASQGTTTKITGQAEFTETDWSAGAGSGYSSQEGSVDETTAGELSISGSPGSYTTSSTWLISNTIDFGTTTTEFISLDYRDISVPASTTAELQIASNNDNLTWNYVGPDGTASTTYEVGTDIAIHAGHDGDQYMRYQVILDTNDPGVTPIVDEVAITFASDCVAQGNRLFQNLNTGSHNITVTANGFDTATTSLNISSGWQEHVIQILEP